MGALRLKTDLGVYENRGSQIVGFSYYSSCFYYCYYSYKDPNKVPNFGNHHLGSTVNVGLGVGIRLVRLRMRFKISTSRSLLEHAVA